MSDQGLYLATLPGIIFLKIVVFVLGYLTIKIGATLLRDGVKGEFRFRSELPGFKGDLASASPGLLFLVVGGILIGFAIGLDKEVSYTSGAASNGQAPVASTPAPAVNIQ